MPVDDVRAQTRHPRLAPVYGQNGSTSQTHSALNMYSAVMIKSASKAQSSGVRRDKKRTAKSRIFNKVVIEGHPELYWARRWKWKPERAESGRPLARKNPDGC